ncbi:MAG: hypothetical protein EPN91_03450 [Salinibacterium sp.]|nr:MAG: hypothetical protein EPN91_03450 [Salinibacterium sp.]
MISWYTPTARAIVAAIAAIAITFSADHSAPLGFLVLGFFAAATGAILIVAGIRGAAGASDRIFTVMHGAIAVVVGVIALSATWAGLPFLVLLLTGFAVITGAIELYLGIRARRTKAVETVTRDQIFIGALTLLLAVAVLLVPPDYVQPFAIPHGVTGQVTASVFVVGLFGAYASVIAVYLVIAGLSLKWHPKETSAVGGHN